MEKKSFFSKIKEADRLIKISIFANIILYIIVSIISTFHSITLFAIFNNLYPLAIATAFSFELGQVVSLLSLSMLDFKNKVKARFLFYSLTFIQVIGNLYSASLSLGAPEALKIFIETISVGLLTAYTAPIAAFLIIILNGSLPIIALLFIENVIQFLTKDDTKTKVIKPIKDSNSEFDDLFSITDTEKIITTNETNNHDTNTSDIDKVLEVNNDENINVISNIQNNQDDNTEMVSEPEINNTIVEKELIDNKTESIIEEPVIHKIVNADISKIKVDKQKTDTVRMKVIEGKDQYTFKNIDKDKLPTF